MLQGVEVKVLGAPLLPLHPSAAASHTPAWCPVLPPGAGVARESRQRTPGWTVWDPPRRLRGQHCAQWLFPSGEGARLQEGEHGSGPSVV